jgi:iron complex outermembrane receptor protein
MSLRLSLLSSAIFLASTAQAAPAPVHSPDDEAMLEEIRVYASPVRARSDEVAQPVEILSGEALARQLGANLGDTVARLPGIQTSYFGPAVGRPIIRGLAGARVKILQDGVGVLDASSTSGDHAVAVEPFLADQIEILKGPATVLYGSGALGGVVNTVTGRLPEQAGEDGYALRGEVRGGDVADERTALLRFDGTKGPWQFHLDGVMRDTEDFDIPGATESAAMIAEEAAEAAEAGEVLDLDELERGTLPNSSLDTEALSGSLNWIGDRVQVGVSVERFQTEYGLPGGHAHHHEEEHPGKNLTTRRPMGKKKRAVCASTSTKPAWMRIWRFWRPSRGLNSSACASRTSIIATWKLSPRGKWRRALKTTVLRRALSC